MVLAPLRASCHVLASPLHAQGRALAGFLARILAWARAARPCRSCRLPSPDSRCSSSLAAIEVHICRGEVGQQSTRYPGLAPALRYAGLALEAPQQTAPGMLPLVAAARQKSLHKQHGAAGWLQLRSPPACSSSSTV